MKASKLTWHWKACPGDMYPFIVTRKMAGSAWVVWGGIPSLTHLDGCFQAIVSSSNTKVSKWFKKLEAVSRWTIREVSLKMGTENWDLQVKIYLPNEKEKRRSRHNGIILIRDLLFVLQKLGGRLSLALKKMCAFTFGLRNDARVKQNHTTDTRNLLHIFITSIKTF